MWSSKGHEAFASPKAHHYITAFQRRRSLENYGQSPTGMAVEQALKLGEVRGWDESPASVQACAAWEIRGVTTSRVGVTAC